MLFLLIILSDEMEVSAQDVSLCLDDIMEKLRNAFPNSGGTVNEMGIHETRLVRLAFRGVLSPYSDSRGWDQGGGGGDRPNHVFSISPPAHHKPTSSSK